MSQPHYYYIKHGRSFGPVPAAELRAMRQAGLLAADDLVRLSTSSRWHTAREWVEEPHGATGDEVAPDAGSAEISTAQHGAHSSHPASRTVFTTAPPAAATTGRPKRPGNRPRKCPRCGIRSRTAGPDCPHCGDPKEARAECPRCGARGAKPAKFCGQCGTAL